MKQLLVALFLILIIGFGVFGYTHSGTDPNQTIEKDTNTSSIQL